MLGWPGLSGSVGFAAAQLAAFAGGLAMLCVVAIVTGARLPWRDLVSAILAAALMAAVIWPLRDRSHPLATLILQVGIGGLLYGSLAIAFDIAGLRDFVAKQAVPRLTRLARLRR